MRAKTKGFSLIEIVIVIAIISIITIIASAIYRPYVMKGRRVDGINSLLSISLAEERYRSNNLQYGTLAQVWGGVTSSPEGYYTLSISNVSATGYTITATAQGNQANDTADATSCTTLSISVSNGTVSRTPANCWPK